MTAPEWQFPKLYHVLGVHPEASASEIADAYARLCDEYQADPEHQRALGMAWAVLGNPQRRALYDREAIVRARGEGAEAARPLVTWAAVFASAVVVELTFGGRDVGSLLFWAYVIACAPWGWRWLTRARRWLGMRGWLSLAYCVAVSPILGAVAAPAQLVAPVLTLGRLGHRRLPELVRSLRRRAKRERR
jgi:hypothetical protein